ncbi:MAG: YggS family pyridoxal phosphate-dependent enzyme [Deltaproteobacteria bacterium]|nr:YggS family pyridoxal phosphate-dependent enzyme [Deltaproteobacteria bacterium]
MSIVRNLEEIQTRIFRASRKVGCNPDSVTLVAVSKTVPVSRIEEAIAAGVEVLGENRVQEARQKIASIGKKIPWHLIGHLQTNKASLAVSLFEMVQSVDSLRVAEALEREAGKREKRLPVLVQVNISGETSKSGVAADEAPDLIEAVAGMPHLQLQGLMTIPPYSADPESGRPIYRRLRELRDRVNAEGLIGTPMTHLSMGMSHDFEVAVEEGATMVRVGTLLFGERR